MSRQELLYRLLQKAEKGNQYLNAHLVPQFHNQSRPATIKRLQILPTKPKKNNEQVSQQKQTHFFSKGGNANNRRIFILQKIKSFGRHNVLNESKTIGDEFRSTFQKDNNVYMHKSGSKISIQNFKTEASSPVKSLIQNRKVLCMTGSVKKNLVQNFDRICTGRQSAFDSKQLDRQNCRKSHIKFQRRVSLGKQTKRNENQSFIKSKEEKAKNLILFRRQLNKNYKTIFDPPPKITAKSYIVYEIVDQFNIHDSLSRAEIKIHTAFNSKIKVQIASLTKIMTCILAIEICEQQKVSPMSEQIKIGNFQSNINGTSARIQPGQYYSLNDLLHGLMLPSGNDASLAIAVWGGKKLMQKKQRADASNGFGKRMKGDYYERFVKEMNLKALALGMQKTTYANSHGLVNFLNKSCAHDVAILSNYCMKNQYFSQIVSTKQYRTTIKVQSKIPIFEKIEVFKHKFNEETRNDKNYQFLGPSEENIVQGHQKQVQKPIKQITVTKYKEIHWENTHKLLHKNSKEYIGIKTGVTTAAGPCLSTCVQTPCGRRIFIVVLSCKKLQLRFKQTELLKKWVFKKEGINKKSKCLENTKSTPSEAQIENEDENASSFEDFEGEYEGQD